MIGRWESDEAALALALPDGHQAHQGPQDSVGSTLTLQDGQSIDPAPFC